MRELSLHILDLAQNSIEAGAHNVIIEINENENGFFVFRISDDGHGMSEEMVQKIRDPFVTTRTTRKVGMGIPFMDMVTKQCGGHLLIQSRKGKGTVVEAAFAKDNIDRPPLGDIVSSIKVLLVGTPYLELKFIYKIGTSGFDIDTRVIRSLLGDEADFTRPEVYTWLEEYLKQEISQLGVSRRYKMKTLEDLKALREKLKADMKVRQNDGTKIIIGMGTCGIAAGAREVMSAVLNELAVRKLNDVQVQQTGCIGMCEKEVLVDIVRPGEPRITYGKVKPEDVKKIIAEHVVNGRIVEEMVVGKIMQD